MLCKHISMIISQIITTIHANENVLERLPKTTLSTNQLACCICQKRSENHHLYLKIAFPERHSAHLHRTKLEFGGINV